MRDFQTKANAGGAPDTISSTRFGAGEFNSIAVELENAVSTSGQTLAPSDGTGEVSNQLAKALSIYGGGGALYFDDSGAVNAYVLTPISPKVAAPAYFDGLMALFEPGTPNTGPATVNVASLGLKSITYANGNPLTGGEIAGTCLLKYNLTNDRFEYIFNSVALLNLGSQYVIDASQADQGATSTNPDTMTIYDVATLVGTSKSATLRLIHNPVAGNTTAFNFDTSLDLSTYPLLEFDIDQGSQFTRTTGDEVLTIYSPENLNVLNDQKLTSVDMIDFEKGGVVYPEYWGAIGDETTNDHNALQYASNSLIGCGGVVQLLAKGYKNDSTWAITSTNHSLVIRGLSVGLSPIDFGSGGTFGTKIIGVNGTDCITITGAGYVEIRDLIIYLAVGATSACIGITLQSNFKSTIENVRVTNFSTEIYCNNNTNTILSKLYLSSTGVTVDPVIGLDIDGTTNQNPSFSVVNSVAAHSSFSGNAYGFYLHGDRINDVFITDCEGSYCTKGLYINGSGVDAGYGGDIQINNFIADGNTTYGIHIADCTIDSLINIDGGWVSGGTELIYIVSSYGISINQVQTFGGNNGIYLASCREIIVSSCNIAWPTANGIYLDSTSYCNIVGNVLRQKSSAGAPNGIGLDGSSPRNNINSNTIFSSANAGWINGINTEAGADWCNIIGNGIQPILTTNPFVLNAGSNTNTVFSGVST